MPRSPNIEIVYCSLCGWGLRANWTAQEMLSTFSDEIASVTLTPDKSGGVFDIFIDETIIYSRKSEGRFPDMKELKQLIRDRVAPERTLGHSDRKPETP